MPARQGLVWMITATGENLHTTATCHNNVGGPFTEVENAPNVYNHFKNGTNISAYWTQPTESESCMGCHNRSEMLYTFDENETNPYFTNFSITSHYGDNRTDLVAMCENNANNTEYCSYCHVNDTPFTSFENIIVNITHAGSANCEDCHGTGRLHGDNVTRVNTSGNCTACHALYGANLTHYMGNGTIKYEINVTAMNLGVHADVNENMTPVAAASPINDSNNSKCWGCHVPDGAYPEYGHSDTFNNDAYLCYECHNGTYAYQNVSNATAVYNHFKSGSPIKARTNATTNSISAERRRRHWISRTAPPATMRHPTITRRRTSMPVPVQRMTAETVTVILIRRVCSGRSALFRILPMRCEMFGDMGAIGSG